MKLSLMKERINKQKNKNLFNEIDINLLFGMQCSGNNEFHQNYLYKIKSQTEFAFINKKNLPFFFKTFLNIEICFFGTFLSITNKHFLKLIEFTFNILSILEIKFWPINMEYLF